MLVSSRSGAIRRASIEKDSNLLTYENFVTELDSGDAFTTSIIDILVKVSFVAHSYLTSQALTPICRK